MSDRYSYRNLILWQRAQDLAHRIIQITKRLPQNWASGIIARQIIASATSVSANIAEGHGRFSLGAHRNHLLIARGSATETDSWLDLMRREELLSEEEERELHNRCSQVIGLLTTKIRSLGEADRDSKTSIREEQFDSYVSNMLLPPFPFIEEDYVKPD
ncbi:MAG TPA: four helix bundle protein [Roseiflexaceae bacterium]|nr:four helix bundle protein [Roseiflexaceae bacterium]